MDLRLQDHHSGFPLSCFPSKLSDLSCHQCLVTHFLSLLAALLHVHLKSDLLRALAGYPFSQSTGTLQVYSVVLGANTTGAEIKVSNSVYMQ